MNAITLTWTALPNGVRRDSADDPWRARVSLFLTPRLEPGEGSAVLGEFPEFEDWPKSLRGLASGAPAFGIVLRDGRRVLPPVPARLRPGTDAPDSRAWRAIFGPDLPVYPFKLPEEPSANDTGLQSYDSGGVLRAIRRAYATTLAAELGASPGPPGLEAFDLAHPERKARAAVDGDPILAFARFHRPPTDPGYARTDEAEPPDFHQVIAAMGTHPQLMRRLGLVFDVELPLDDLALEDTAADRYLRVHPPDMGLGDAVHHHTPWTRVDFDTVRTDRYRGFGVAGTRRRGAIGLFALDSPQVTVAQEQVEHAAFALIQQATMAGTDDAAPATMPALLQGGMRVSHAEKPALLGDAISKQSSLARSLHRSRQGTDATDPSPSEEEIIHAEHVTRGFRVDVQNVTTGQWRSLCRRLVRYATEHWSWPDGAGHFEDEGTLEPTASREQRVLSPALRVTDDLFDWDGWSLAVPRPQGDDAGAIQARPDYGSPLQSHLEVPPGSLEPQRFGETYRFRLRDVDIAGNSLSVDEADALEATGHHGTMTTAPVTCLRVESVKPPVVIRGQPRGVGEAGDLVVLREADAREHRTNEFRLHVAPPEVSFRIAEKHGLFDAYSDADAWQLIGTHRRDPGKDEDGKPVESIPAPEFYTPYLADPLVRQAVLILPDGGGVIDMPRFDDIPRLLRRRELARSCRLLFRPGRDRFRARVAGRSVIVEVPPGRVYTVRLVAKLSPEDLKLLAMSHPDWHDDHRLQSVDQQTVLIQKAAHGETPSLAPSRELKIVCASQRPLARPAFGRPMILPRAADTTTALLADDALAFDRPSTGRIDVYARWQDPFDDPDEPHWQIVEREIYAGGVRIGDDDTKPLDPLELSESPRSPLAHDFGDTRHHRVTYTATALSRFIEFYAPSLTDDPQNTTLTSGPVTLDIPATAPPSPPDVAFVLPTFSEPTVVGNDAGELISRRSGNGLRLYMDRGWFSSGRGEQLALVLSAADSTNGSDDLPVTEWGENPLHDGAPLPGPMRLEHVWSGVDRIDRFTTEDGAIALAMHDVGFSEEHGLPFVDIEFHAQRAFMPLVRLAVARYQRHAIDGCRLSAIAQADFVPLAPGRALTIRRSAIDTWHLTLRGYSLGKTGVSDVFSPVPATTVVQAHIECMPVDAPEDPAAWRMAGEPTQLTADALEPWHFRWQGRAIIDDADFLTRHWRRRLVVQEFEPFEVAGGNDVPLADRARLVFAQTVPLSP